MPRKVFYSFYYRDDASRVQQVKNIGKVEGQPVLTGNEWEAIEKSGPTAVRSWIDRQMIGKTCLIVLVGSKTATRPYVQYEIRKAWEDGLGVVGIRIHGLKDMQSQSTSAAGSNPFEGSWVGNLNLGNVVKLYNPPGGDSKSVYGSIADNIEHLVEEAIRNRPNYR